MPKGRPRFGFLVFDCPSDHEIDGSLVTESETIRAVLANRNLGSRLKVVRVSTVKSVEALPNRAYSGVRYVHLGGHGSLSGLDLVGGRIKWPDVAKTITSVLPTLKEKEQRVLTLSCCYSEQGVLAMKLHLKGYFSAAYHFVPITIGFSQAITVWSMFYLKKKLRRPHGAIAQDINAFLKEDILAFVAI